MRRHRRDLRDRGQQRSAAVNTTTTTTVGIKAFVDNGFQGSLVGVPGGAVALTCSAGTSQLGILGTASNGMAKSNYSDEGNAAFTQSNDDFDNGDVLPLNLVVGPSFDEVTGHGEAVNGAQSRTLTVQYSTEDGPPNSTADCAVWGTAVKGIYEESAWGLLPPKRCDPGPASAGPGRSGIEFVAASAARPPSAAGGTEG